MNAKKQSLIEQKVENDAEKLAKSQDWESATKFPWSEKIHEILRNVFGLKKFRSSQLSVINATLSGNDVMVIMPTGGGKSLCYQLPALANTPNKGKHYTQYGPIKIGRIKNRHSDFEKKKKNQ